MLSNVIGWLVKNSENKANDLNAFKPYDEPNDKSNSLHFSISVNVLVIVPWTRSIALLQLVDTVQNKDRH